jgi:cytidylate kinase
LRPAADAVILDTTGLSIAEVVQRALALARAAAGQDGG